jgi:adenine-specific DNA-methyltransferase
MATSVPSKNGNGVGQTLELSYPAKKSISEILSVRNASRFDPIRETAYMNRLYCGDNLAALRTLLEDESVRGKVTLIYIDPPFATRGSFLSRNQRKAYEDNLCGAEYVENLRHRLVLLRELLSSSGSIYLHLDENMIFQIKLVMDEVFGAANYRNLIVRKKCNPKNYTSKAYGNIADFILFYSKTDRYVWNRPVEPLSEQSTKEYHYVEPETGRRFMKVPVHAPGKRNGATGGPWRGMLPPLGKHWQYTPETLDQMDARGEIFWSKNGNPRRKVYLDQHSGVGVQDIWLDFKDAHNQNIKITGYPTEKTPDLLRRILEASSRPGDLVLDCYAGSGTTMAVANELQRHWIGIDCSPEAISTILERFERGLKPMGDYVAKKESRATYSFNQPSLFDSLDEKTRKKVANALGDHLPITDFSVYVEQGESVGLKAIVERWLERQGLFRFETVAHAMVVSESSNLADACYELHSRDKVLAKIIDAIGPCNLRPHQPRFDFLVDAIISQQLSKQAAETITKRLREIFRASRPTPKAFIRMPREEIMATGVSARKYEYILDLAQRLESGRLGLSRLSGESDDSIRESLKQVKGIGDWTVDMFLLFGLGRLNIFPVHDLALRKAMSIIYKVNPNDVKLLQQLASRWSPYRSVGSWYLYRNANTQQDKPCGRGKPRR